MKKYRSCASLPERSQHYRVGVKVASDLPVVMDWEEVARESGLSKRTVMRIAFVALGFVVKQMKQ